MKCAVFALFLCLAALQAHATELRPQGSKTLGIVFSDTEFSLSLAVPGSEIVGFGRPAENDDERALVAVAISDLSKPLELFVVPDAAGCFTTSANVTLSGESLGQEDGATGSSDQPLTNSEHTEFQAEYIVQCQDLGALDRIEFAYFDRFEGTDKLTVQIEKAGAVRAFEVTRATPLLDLSAI